MGNLLMSLKEDTIKESRWGGSLFAWNYDEIVVTFSGFRSLIAPILVSFWLFLDLDPGK
jgi:hypothetical protein